VTLEQAFAPVAVMTGDGEDRIELFSFAAAHSRFLVLGGPGTGKTTLMKSMIINILNRRCHPDLNQLIPVLVVLREMATSDHSVEEAIVSALAKLRFKKADASFSSYSMASTRSVPAAPRFLGRSRIFAVTMTNATGKTAS
jgi:hypothetical protein